MKHRSCSKDTFVLCIVCFFKYGPNKPLFVYFPPFLNTMIKYCTIDFMWKKHTWSAWDSNPGPQNGRRANENPLNYGSPLVLCDFN